MERSVFELGRDCANLMTFVAARSPSELDVVEHNANPTRVQ